MSELPTGENATSNLKRSQDVLSDNERNKRVSLAANTESALEIPNIRRNAGGKGCDGVADELQMGETSSQSCPKSKHVSRRDAAGFAKSRKGKEKSWKNAGRKRGSRNQEEDGEIPPANSQRENPPRLPKRQCALLIGFCGTGCNGMQIQTNVQPPVRTIEGVLFESLVRAGAVSHDNADDPVKVNLGRAARTDAGVHAAGNVVSIKMITSVPGVSDMVTRINEELPPEIRLWGFVRVQNSFNARLSCDSRKYTYFFPTYLLIPPRPGSVLHDTLQKYAASISPAFPAPGDNTVHSFWAKTDTAASTREDDLLHKRMWRIDPDQLDALRQTAKKLEGTHNFHNFTVGRDFSDRSAQRHMKKIEVSDPAVYGNTEWISVMFHGQSFMLHQIRKMMSVFILSCRTGTPRQVIDELYGPQVVFVPKMPSLGLLLEQPIFDSYNKKVSSINEKLDITDPEYRPPIDFENFQDSINKFKQNHIYDNMRSIEDRDGVFDAWIRSIDAYGGNDMLYLNPKGIIPAAAIIKKGAKRDSSSIEKKRSDVNSFPVPDQLKVKDDDDDDSEGNFFLDKACLADMEG